VLQLCFTAIHSIPFLALIKRRLNTLHAHMGLWIAFTAIFLMQFSINGWSFYYGASQIMARTFIVCASLMLLGTLLLIFVPKSEQ